LLRLGSGWDAAGWQRQLARVESDQWAVAESVDREWVPVFIVGMPRSGTTLLSELLTRDAPIRNRGELMWIPELHDQIISRAGQRDARVLAEAADYYRMMVVQDDPPVRWYLDKQTLNFLHLGLVAALFPHAQVIYCVRDPRDTALSIWSQRFGGASDFARDFESIEAVGEGCKRLMRHWQSRLPVGIHTVVYEDLVAAPQRVVRELRGKLGMPANAECGEVDALKTSVGAVATASMWQVRQPVTSRSVGRWRHYADLLPDLAVRFAPEA
jgi:hypothetical protein